MRIYFLILIFIACIGNQAFSGSLQKGSQMLKINTSNEGKFKEFQRLFHHYNVQLKASHIDLDEIDADPISVVVHKASQLEEGTIVEDTSLEIEGTSVGVNVRWLLDHLPQYVDRKAEWLVLLAVKKADGVYVYKGVIKGKIVDPRGVNGFGFDPVFLPDGASKTLAESKPDQFNARAKAVEALMKGDVFKKQAIIKDWKGSWQKK